MATIDEEIIGYLTSSESESENDVAKSGQRMPKAVSGFVRGDTVTTLENNDKKSRLPAVEVYDATADLSSSDDEGVEDHSSLAAKKVKTAYNPDKRKDSDEATGASRELFDADRWQKYLEDRLHRREAEFKAVKESMRQEEQDKRFRESGGKVIAKMYGKGYDMLRKMGYTGGGLGKEGTGIQAPISVKLRAKKKGLQEHGERVTQLDAAEVSEIPSFLIEKPETDDVRWKIGSKPKDRVRRTAADLVAAVRDEEELNMGMADDGCVSTDGSGTDSNYSGNEWDLYDDAQNSKASISVRNKEQKAAILKAKQQRLRARMHSSRITDTSPADFRIVDMTGPQPQIHADQSSLAASLKAAKIAATMSDLGMHPLSTSNQMAFNSTETEARLNKEPLSKFRRRLRGSMKRYEREVAEQIRKRLSQEKKIEECNKSLKKLNFEKQRYELLKPIGSVVLEHCRALVERPHFMLMFKVIGAWYALRKRRIIRFKQELIAEVEESRQRRIAVAKYSAGGGTADTKPALTAGENLYSILFSDESEPTKISAGTSSCNHVPSPGDIVKTISESFRAIRQKAKFLYFYFGIPALAIALGRCALVYAECLSTLQHPEAMPMIDFLPHLLILGQDCYSDIDISEYASRGDFSKAFYPTDATFINFEGDVDPELRAEAERAREQWKHFIESRLSGAISEQMAAFEISAQGAADMKAFLLQWQPAFSVELLARALVQHFFPRWFVALAALLACDEPMTVAVFYEAWKDAFPEELQSHALVQGELLRGLRAMEASILEEENGDISERDAPPLPPSDEPLPSPPEPPKPATNGDQNEVPDGVKDDVSDEMEVDDDDCNSSNISSSRDFEGKVPSVTVAQDSSPASTISEWNMKVQSVNYGMSSRNMVFEETTWQTEVRNVLSSRKSEPRTVKEALQKFAEELDVLFVPKKGRVFNGNQIYYFGEAQIYIENGVVYRHGVGNNERWTLVSLESLLNDTKAK